MNKQKAMPDYKRLTQTPKTKSDRKLREQIQLGTGRKTIRLKGHRPAVHHLQSDRRYLPAKPKPQPTTYIDGGKRIANLETPSPYPFAQARQGTGRQRNFLNKTDNPWTQRQTQRLQQKVLSGQYDKKTQTEIQRL